MRKWAPYILAGLLLLLAAAFRLTNLDWDEYNHYHPDERYITWVATSIEWPDSLSVAFEPHLSPFNPFYWPPGATSSGIVLEEDQPRRYAYGHFPLYLGVAATRLMEELAPVLGQALPNSWSFVQDLLNGAERNEYRHITIVGRALTGLVDIFSVLLLFVLGRQVFGVWVGLIGALFASVTVLFLQLARFFTVDAYLTFFVLLAVTLLSFALDERAKKRRRLVFIFLAAGSIGLAVGSKFTGVLLIIPLAATIFLQSNWSLKRRLLTFIIATTLALLVFFLTNPFAVLDQTCEVATPYSVGPIKIPERILRSCYLQNIGLQASMVQGNRDVPFVRQYADTIPFLYYIEMQLRWGMGLLLGIAAFAGFGWGILRGGSVLFSWWKGRRMNIERQDKPQSDWLEGAKYPFSLSEFVVLSWTIPFFISTGALSVKFMRYLAPLIPFLLIYAAAMLLSIRKVRLRRAVIVVILLVTGLYAVAFINIYRQPHPWISASKWIYNNVENGSTIVSEMWDDRLPDSQNLPEHSRQDYRYETKEVNWLSGTEEKDDLAKIRDNLTTLAEADYIAIASNRNYGVIPRLPERYPLSSQYYPLLFDGRLGYDVIYVGTRMPNLFGVHLKPDSFHWPGLIPPEEVQDFLDNVPGINIGRFDESFTVYDQPLVIIFKNSDNRSVDEMLGLFAMPYDVQGLEENGS